MTELTAARLRELLDYDPPTGVFTWKPIPVTTRYDATRNGRYVGTVAGAAQTNGYVRVQVEGRLYAAHRLAWFYVHGEWPERDLDHADLNRANNAINNLRAATRGENIHSRPVKATSRIGLKGVKANRDRFSARIQKNGVVMNLGTFDTPEAAHAAYVKAANDLYGKFGRAA